jgi:Leucine-rich repeat (LRR) protein
LDSRDISDDGLRHLQQLRNLKSLDIFSGRITDAGCSHISAMTSLESLELCGGGVGDLGCIALAALENLTSLNLSQNERITNRGAAALATLANLKVLNLSNTRVNSSALRFFGGLLKLQSLALYGCRGIDHAGCLEKLQDELPNLKCLRLNRTSDQDGVVHTDGSSDEDSDSGIWSDNGQHGLEAMEQDIDADSNDD